MMTIVCPVHEVILTVIQLLRFFSLYVIYTLHMKHFIQVVCTE